MAFINGTSGNDNISGTDNSDTIYGQRGDDKLNGKKGDDAIFGGGGDDKIYGGKGNDHLYGGPDVDIMVGGKGRDMFFVDTGSIDNIKDFDPLLDRIIFNDNTQPYGPQPFGYLDQFSFSNDTLLYQGSEIVKVDAFIPDIGNLMLI